MNKNLFSNPVKLSLMMFFQYMIFAVWWVPLAAYLTNMGVEGVQKSLVLSSMAIGCMASPIIGMVADRFFAGEKVLATLNLFSSAMLLLAGLTSNPNWLFLFLLLAMLFYMPTWGLTSSIAMAHAQPDTPSSGAGKKTSVTDALGLRTVRLMKDRNFAVFIILSFLSMIPFSMYWSYCSEFLLDRKFEYISITMNLGQLAELLFMVTVPFAIRKVGLRNTLIIGLTALLIRYVVFYTGSITDMPVFFLIGILVHGIIFGFFYLGGQIYIDQKAPAELKAQAQGFIFFVTFGLGLLVGNFISGQVIEHFSVTGKTYDWNSIWAVTSFASLALLLAFILLFRKENQQKIVI